LFSSLSQTSSSNPSLESHSVVVVVFAQRRRRRREGSGGLGELVEAEICFGKMEGKEGRSYYVFSLSNLSRRALRNQRSHERERGRKEDATFSSASFDAFADGIFEPFLPEH